MTKPHLFNGGVFYFIMYLYLYDKAGQWKADKINQKMANWIISNEKEKSNGIIFFVDENIISKSELVFHYPPYQHYAKNVINIYRVDKIEEEATKYLYMSIDNKNQIEISVRASNYDDPS